MLPAFGGSTRLRLSDEQRRAATRSVDGSRRRGKSLDGNSSRKWQLWSPRIRSFLTPLPASANDAGPIVSRERLGGILNYYCRAA